MQIGKLAHLFTHWRMTGMVQFAENRISSSTSSTDRFAIRRERRIRESVTPRIGPKNAKTQIANELASELWSRLPISRLVDETGHRSLEQIIRVANSSHSQIVARHQELRQWVKAICHAAIEIRGDEEVSEQFATNLIWSVPHHHFASGRNVSISVPLPITRKTNLRNLSRSPS